MRDLKELRWRSKGPALPVTVLNAATLRTGTDLPATYRTFLSQMDGGKPGRGAFTSEGHTWVIEAFYSFADAAAHREKLNKSGRLVPGFLPVAFAEAFDKPLVFLELVGDGAVWIKPSPRTRWEDAGAVTRVADSFSGFLDLLGDAPPVVVAAPVAAAVPAGGNGALAPAHHDAPAAEAPAAPTPSSAGKSAAEKRPAPAAKPAPKPAAPKPAAPKPAVAKPAARPAAKAPAKKAKKAPAKKAPAKKAKARTAAKRPAPTKAKKTTKARPAAKKAGKKAAAKKKTAGKR